MAALMNVLREEVTVATTGALSTSAPTVVSSTMSKTIMTAVKQEAISTVTTQTTTTTTSSLLKEVALTDGASLLPKSQLEAPNSPRELLSNALQQGLESLGDTMLDKGAVPKPA